MRQKKRDPPKTGSRFILLFFWVWLGLPAVSPAQTEIEERLLENGSDAVSPDAAEHLDFLSIHPVPVNAAGNREFETIPLFTPSLARAAVLERKNNGPFRDLGDLRKRLHLDPSFAEAVEPFMTFSLPEKTENFRIHARIRAQREYPVSDGYKKGKYSGSPMLSYRRADFNYGNRFKGGLIFEKDPGEMRWNDHTAGFLQVTNRKETFRLTAGHFIAEAGQGLVFWNSFSPAAGSEPVASVRKATQGIRGYSSSGENCAFFGGAVEWRSRRLRILAFGSRTGLDAPSDSDGTVTGFATSGLHRTESERHAKDALGESVFGTRWETDFARFRVGVSGLWTRYDRKIDATDPERRPFGFRGSFNSVTGVDWDASLGRFNGSWEWSVSRGGGKAWIACLLGDFEGASFIVSLRNYDADFQNQRACGFGKGDTRNEKGWYFGLNRKISDRTSLGFDVDLFATLARTYYIPLPTRGADYAVQAQHQLSEAATVKFKARFKDCEIIESSVLSDGKRDDLLTGRTQRYMRFELELKPQPGLKVRTRVEMTAIHEPGLISTPPFSEKGILIFEDVRCEFSRRLLVSLRLTTFDTDSYDSRICMLESDLAGTTSLFPLYKKCRRWSILIRWLIARDLALSLKMGDTCHAFEESWGTGNDRISGNEEKKCGIQLDWTIK
jgi:hypothetical protein